MPGTNGCISPSSKGSLDCDVSHIAIISLHRLVLLCDDSEDVTHPSLWHSYYLAVLIAYQPTAKSQMGVYHRGQDRVEFVQNKKYSAKSGDFLRFYAYLCHVIDDFCLS